MKRLFLGLIVLAACGSMPAKVPDHPGPPAPETAGDPTCPLLVPGTSLTVEDTANGAALVFVTTGDTAAVRTRATALAQMHTAHEGPANAMGMMFSPTSTAAASEIQGGARIEFNAKNPDDAAAVQKELRMHAGHLTGGTCEM